MALRDTLVFETERSVIGFVVFASLVLPYLLCRAITSRRISKSGGTRAPVVAGNPVTTTWLFLRAGWYQTHNNLNEFYNSLFCVAAPESTHCVEITFYGGVRYIITRDPGHIKAVLSSKFSDFGKGQQFHQVMRPFLGDGIFTTDGQLWQDSRSLLRPLFVKDRIRDLAIFEHWTGVLMSMLPPSGETVDINDLFFRMTLDVSTEFLLGTSVNCLRNPSNELANAFNDVQRIQMLLVILAPVRQLVPRNRYYRGIRIIDEYLAPIIKQALALGPDELDELSLSDKNFTFLHSLARFTRDPKVIRDQLVGVFVAGRDTTAATLSWTIFELSRHPAVLARLRNEILSTLGPTASPTYEDLKKMTYLTYALNETLRIYPAGPYNIREALRDSKLPGWPGHADITVLKGDVVVYSPLAMQQRTDLYPPVSETFADPATFSPERWEHWTPKAWHYLPFNGGPRICVGQNFAMTEMALCLVRLLQKYDHIEYRDDYNAQFHKAEIVGVPGRGVRVALFEAREEGPS